MLGARSLSFRTLSPPVSANTAIVGCARSSDFTRRAASPIAGQTSASSVSSASTSFPMPHMSSAG